MNLSIVYTFMHSAFAGGLGLGPLLLSQNFPKLLFACLFADCCCLCFNVAIECTANIFFYIFR